MQVCREAVVRIAHEKAHELDKAGLGGLGEEVDLTAQLRPVTMDDFAEARKKVRTASLYWRFAERVVPVLPITVFS